MSWARREASSTDTTINSSNAPSPSAATGQVLNRITIFQCSGTIATRLSGKSGRGWHEPAQDEPHFSVVVQPVPGAVQGLTHGDGNARRWPRTEQILVRT